MCSHSHSPRTASCWKWERLVRNFARLAGHYGPERCVGFDVANYGNHPRVREVDVRQLSARDDFPIALAWNDLSDWQQSPESKEAGLEFALRNMVAGAYYMDACLSEHATDRIAGEALPQVCQADTREFLVRQYVAASFAAHLESEARPGLTLDPRFEILSASGNYDCLVRQLLSRRRTDVPYGHASAS